MRPAHAGHRHRRAARPRRGPARPRCRRRRQLGLGSLIMISEETTAFANGLIFDGVSDELREGCLRVAAGVIVEVGEGPEPGDRIMDCRGRTVVPGLIDAHFHAYAAGLSLLEIETSPLSYLALAGARRLAGALGRGFTTVRDPGGGDAGLTRAIREGLT